MCASRASEGNDVKVSSKGGGTHSPLISHAALSRSADKDSRFSDERTGVLTTGDNGCAPSTLATEVLLEAATVFDVTAAVEAAAGGDAGMTFFAISAKRESIAAAHGGALGSHRALPNQPRK